MNLKLRSLLFNPSATNIMHPLFQKASGLTESIIAAAIEVHRDKGLGLIEAIYEWCLTKELELRGLNWVSQKTVPIDYKGFTREEPLRFDVLVKVVCWLRRRQWRRLFPFMRHKFLAT